MSTVAGSSDPAVPEPGAPELAAALAVADELVEELVVELELPLLQALSTNAAAARAVTAMVVRLGFTGFLSRGTRSGGGLGDGQVKTGACGTISGLPVSGSGMTRAATPKTCPTSSAVTTAAGDPSATIRPACSTIRWVAYRAA